MKQTLPSGIDNIPARVAGFTRQSVRHFVVIVLLTSAQVIYAHEFWLAPHAYTVASGEEMNAAIRVGQMLNGAELPYLSRGFSEFTVRTRAGTAAVTGFEGDLPAFSHTAEVDGLQVITYHSTANTITYKSWDEFLNYLTYEGLDDLANAHVARELPQQNFEERYFRFAKTLIQAGAYDDADADVAQGAPLEIVAEENPYKPGLDELPVRLLRHNVPVANRQIAIIRYDGTVTRTLIHTDGNGRALIPVAGGGTFLLNTTDLQPAEEVAWQSYWASLSFGLPIAVPEHPLDPLSRIEIVRAVLIIGRSGHADKDTRIASLTLAEPDKGKVLAWQPGTAFPRRAVAVVRNGVEVFEAIVDFHTASLSGWRHLEGVQPALASAEWSAAQALVKADPRMLSALQARGYGDVSEIFCEGLPVGYFAGESERRLVKMPCYDIAGARSHIYGKPIEGLVAVVDLNAREVVDVIDSGAIAVSKQPHEFKGDDVPIERALDAQAGGTDRPFTMDARTIEWHDWSFHLGFDERFGTVISRVEHAGDDGPRSVLYQGFISELFVPYMDPDEAWYFRTPMDVGEYGLGTLASPLTPGIDCPRDAAFIDADVALPTGSVYTRQRVVCVFERQTSEPLWRHWEGLNGAYEGRRAAELVVRSIPAIGNYDYIVDWVFTQAGEIDVNIGATGIDAVKGVNADDAKAARASGADDTGMLVAPNLVAVHHDHYFSLRLDVDVDGPINSFVRERLAVAQDTDNESRRAYWQLEDVPAPIEEALSARGGTELWRVENPVKRTALGHKPSYQIAGHGVTSMLRGRDAPHRRGAFAGEKLWVTKRRPGELFAAGRFPNQSPGGDGVQAYVNGEEIQGEDVVVWYTIGFNHLTRPEDWPVLPTVWHGVKLRPSGLFARNPAAPGSEH
jgi:primary-amine oxidase